MEGLQSESQPDEIPVFILNLLFCYTLIISLHVSGKINCDTMLSEKIVLHVKEDT